MQTFNVRKTDVSKLVNLLEKDFQSADCIELKWFENLIKYSNLIKQGLQHP